MDEPNGYREIESLRVTAPNGKQFDMPVWMAVDILNGLMRTKTPLYAKLRLEAETGKS
jgi:hypothetical protein